MRVYLESEAAAPFRAARRRWHDTRGDDGASDPSAADTAKADANLAMRKTTGSTVLQV
jgi:hypothetical protein